MKVRRGKGRGGGYKDDGMKRGEWKMKKGGGRQKLLLSTNEIVIIIRLLNSEINSEEKE